MPPDLNWDEWRPISKGYATLDEIHSSWSLLDLWEANAVISAIEAAEAEAYRRARKT